jgi:hypothetical protein
MEYSARYRVSLSTLRRRIKAGDIEYKFSDGKYLLKDGPLQPSHPEESETIAPPTSVTVSEEGMSMTGQTTQMLLNEIKKAYSLVLQEKEEQILQLKDEVADLKTLVRVLEDQNALLSERRATEPRPSSEPFDLMLEA